MINLNPQWDLPKRTNETQLLERLVETAGLSDGARRQISAHAADLVRQIRGSSKPSLMDLMLSEYGLSTDEGVALMCLAEALLRVPDADTIDALIEDKIAPSDWSRHLGHSTSPLINASTWGLLLTGRILHDAEPGIAGTLRALIRRVGEPVIRTAVSAAMKEMGRQFVMGETIEAAMARAKAEEADGYSMSYDMLGEAAMTADDAARYFQAYQGAIAATASAAQSDDIGQNPGISVKLSALHPRYEPAKTDRVMKELLPRLTALTRQAAEARIGLNIDAEEADRLGLSMQLIDAAMSDPGLPDWDGFGVVVQAYSRRASHVIDGLTEMAERHDRRIMVRLVKGAYWDTEIKHAQVEGLTDFPVFTRKVATDVSYLANARTLLSRTDRIYPQFATHNAHTLAAVLHMAGDLPKSAYEVQRLHGMGETLHEILHEATGLRSRIYAPVGAHRDLLAYLVRRLLENGANSSFVNQIVDHDVPPEEIAACPFDALAAERSKSEPSPATGPELFQPERPNSNGFDLADAAELAKIDRSRAMPVEIDVRPILAVPAFGTKAVALVNPSREDVLGSVTNASAEDVAAAFDAAQPWSASAEARSATLSAAADLLEQNSGEIFALLAAEAGKTLRDAVAELREAVDFIRYYSARANKAGGEPRGIAVCISPWNFPLAIFLGQVTAALSTGNAVLAKPAEETPAIAALAVGLFHQAGVPRTALQLLPGDGATVGAALTGDARVGLIAFTGSTETAKIIQRSIARHCAPGTPLIAETGGLNAMIIDSTALPEQAVRDIVASAFQSAGQRCSALRCLYVQDDIADALTEMLVGAMNELQVGDPWQLETDVGPIISAPARDDIAAYVATAKADGRLLHQLDAPGPGHFVGPALIRVNGIRDLEREIFGPVLHIATFRADEIERVVDDINATGYGLTFGIHSRMDNRVQELSDRISAGNVYANRNQIGAVVGSQPFGGEGLSGTGPKAGGPNYQMRFTKSHAAHARPAASQVLPGPTGELNRLETHPRPPLLCLGPGREQARKQAEAVEALGGTAKLALDWTDPQVLTGSEDLGGAIWWGDDDAGGAIAIALADRPGPIIPLITGHPDPAHVLYERHLCVDTTAAGGNASLLSGEG